MPKSRIVVTNPVDKIDPNKVKELMAWLGQKPEINSPSTNKKKVKRKGGSGKSGSGEGNNNKNSVETGTGDLGYGSNIALRKEQIDNLNNGTSHTPWKKITNNLDYGSTTSLREEEADDLDYGSTISLRKEAKDNLKNGTSLTPWKKVTDAEPFKAERFYDYGQYNPSTNPNTIGGDGRLRKKYPPQLFWGALIGAGVNMASSLIGGSKAKKQAAEQAKIAEQQRLKAEAEANLASDQVQLKSYVPSNNPGYFEGGGDVIMPAIRDDIKKKPILPNSNKVRQEKVKKYLNKYGHLPPSMMANGRAEYSDINVEDALSVIKAAGLIKSGLSKARIISFGRDAIKELPQQTIQYGRGATYKKQFGDIKPEAIDSYLKEFLAGGTVESNSFTPSNYGVNISPNAQFLTNADGSTYGDHSTGNEVPIYNKDKKLIALAHPREILYTKPDGDQVVLSEARGYSTAYNNLQNMINERKVKLFKTRKDPKGDISRDIQDLVKAQVGLVAKQEEDSANPNQMKYGGRVRRKDYGGNTNSDFPPTNEYNRQLNMLPGILNKMNSFTDNIQRNIENSMIGINNSDNKVTSSNTDVVNTDPSKPWRNPNIPTIKPSIILEQEPLTGNQLNRRVTHYNDPSSPENQTFWDKAKGVMRTPEFQNAAIGTVGNVASNLISNSYLSAADKMISNLKPVHTRYAPINERVDVSGQEASAQNAFNLAKSEIDNVSDPTRRAALLNDLTSRYVSNNNEIAGNRINAEIAKQNTNVNAANQVSAQNAVASNAFNQYKAESRAGILGAKATNMGNMMTKIMQGVQDYRLGQNDKAKLDMVLQRFKSGVADRMDYDALENIFGIIKGTNKDGK